MGWFSLSLKPVCVLLGKTFFHAIIWLKQEQERLEGNRVNPHVETRVILYIIPGVINPRSVQKLPIVWYRPVTYNLLLWTVQTALHSFSSCKKISTERAFDLVHKSTNNLSDQLESKVYVTSLSFYPLLIETLKHQKSDALQRSVL